ncbi:MAG: hypothetical protein ACI8W7_004932, partial [Gammaproteobacteria bacterium]
RLAILRAIAKKRVNASHTLLPRTRQHRKHAPPKASLKIWTPMICAEISENWTGEELGTQQLSSW